MAKIEIAPDLAIDEDELEESFIASAGPGGQNVNKVATAVQLRFDALHSPSLPADLRHRLVAIAGKRLTKEGVLVLTGRRFRTQERNRADVRERLVSLLRQAAHVPRPRRSTRPPKASKKQRLDEKGVRGQLKRLRGRPSDD